MFDEVNEHVFLVGEFSVGGLLGRALIRPRLDVNESLQQVKLADADLGPKTLYPRRPARRRVIEPFVLRRRGDFQLGERFGGDIQRRLLVAMDEISKLESPRDRLLQQSSSFHTCARLVMVHWNSA